MPQGELEVAIEVDKAAYVHAQVRQRDRAHDPGQADSDVNVLEVLQAIHKPVGRGWQQVGNRTQQPLQADAGQEHVGIERRHGRHREARKSDVAQIDGDAKVDGRQLKGEVEPGQIEGEEIENTQVGLHAHPEEVRVETHVQGGGVAADRNVQALAAIDDAEVRIHRGQRHAHGECAIELKHHVPGVQREVGVGADQAGQAGLGRQAKEIEWQPGAAQGGAHQGQRKVEVGHGNTNGVVVGFVNAVVVAVGFVGAVEAGKGLHLLACHDERVGGHFKVHA